MRVLAEFAMRSRLHAIGTSMVAALVPLLGWLSTVLVALVVLRHGIPAGSLVLLWTLLPLGAIFHFAGDPFPVLVLGGTFLAAALLRQTGSWQVALVALVSYAAISLLAIRDYLVGFLAGLFTQMKLELSPEEILQLTPLYALWLAIILLSLLIFARWGQSALYNPGGFRQEFHHLRLSPIVSAVLGIIALGGLAFPEHLGSWLPLFMLPLVVAAAGLAHWYFALKKLSLPWVVMFYLSLILLFEYSTPLLASLALMDSWLNLRVKLQTI